MADYATTTEVAAYMGVAFTDEATLLQAERDVDSLVGYYTLESNGLKFGHPKGANEKGLTAGQVVALTRATCAQAEYRLEMGPEFFKRAQYEQVSGPDFTITGTLPRIGPKVNLELEGAGLGVGQWVGVPWT